MSDWFELLFTYDEIEAQIVKKLLETEGIQVKTKQFVLKSKLLLLIIEIARKCKL
jgi:hypothetical protein